VFGLLLYLLLSVNPISPRKGIYIKIIIASYETFFTLKRLHGIKKIKKISSIIEIAEVPTRERELN
jgi:hypothetical protein